MATLNESLSGALSLLLLGSMGTTFDEILNLMGLATGVDIRSKGARVHEQLGLMLCKLEQTSGFDVGNQISFASAMFVQKDFAIRESYKEASRDIYQSEVLNLDFKGNAAHAQGVVNSWVATRTGGKIVDLLETPPPPDTKLIITSVLYFKSSWEHPFYEGHTRW